MKIALVNEGTYPFVPGGVSTWCHQLTTGLDRHAFHLVAMGAYAGRQRPAYALPANVTAVHAVPVWDRPVPVSGQFARRRHRRAGAGAAALLCRGLLDDGPTGTAVFGEALRGLAELASGGAHPLYDVPLAEVLLESWRVARNAGTAADTATGGDAGGIATGGIATGGTAGGITGTTTGGTGGDAAGTATGGTAGGTSGGPAAGYAGSPATDGALPAGGGYFVDGGLAVGGRAGGGAIRLPLPRLTMREARDAAVLLEHAVRPLAYQLPPVDVCHPVAAGLPVLVALAAKWRSGTPYLLTEHGIYLRERYLELGAGGLPVAVKAVMLRFYRALSRLGYAEAGLVSSVSRFNQRWELRHGAHPDRLLVVPNGVAPDAYPCLETEPEQPTVVWVGRVDPLKDLHTLITAFDLVRREVPGAVLRLAGPVPATGQAYADSCHKLVADLGLADAVTFVGPVSSSREAYATGNLVALSSISEGMPYTVIEAMMCGRATVSTDVGGVAETVGDAGLVVPPGDPAAFAAACVSVLRDPARRAELARSARQRALAHFTLDQMLAAYDGLYTDVAATAARPHHPTGGGR